MGTRLSRRFRANRNMDSDSNFEDSDPGDVNEDITTFLSLLLRSGHVVGNVPLSHLNEDSDEDFGPTTSRGSAHSPKTPLKNSDFTDHVLSTSGSFSRCHKKSLPSVLLKREIGRLGKRGHMDSRDKASVNNSFLPNWYEEMKKFPRKVFCGTFSSDGNIFLSACQDEHIRIYDSSGDSLQLIRNITARDVGWSVLDTAFSPDGLFIIYSSWSDSIHLCNVYGENDVHVSLPLAPEGHQNFCIFSLKFSMDNKEILGGSNEGYVYIFDRERNERTMRVKAHDDDVNAVCFADQSSHILYSGGDDGLVKVWDRRAMTNSHPPPVAVFAGHRDGITFIDTKNDGRFLVSNCKDQTIKLWDIRCPSSESAQSETRKAVSSQHWDYRWQSGPLSRRKPSTITALPGDTSVMTFRGHSVLNTLVRCRFSPMHCTGQRYIYTGCARGSLIIYDSLTGVMERALKPHKACVRDVSWHPYKNEIMTSSWDGSICRARFFPSLEEVDNEVGASMHCSLPRKKKKVTYRPGSSGHPIPMFL